MLKKSVALILLSALLTGTQAEAAPEQRCWAYEECRRAPFLAVTAVALGAAVLAAMVLIVIDDSSCSHSH